MSSKKLQILGGIPSVADDVKAVSYDAVQNLSDEQKELARTNIGAVDLETLHDEFDGHTHEEFWNIYDEEGALPYSIYWQCVAYGNGKFVAMPRTDDKAAYSTDGITWTATTMPSRAVWYSVAYGNGKFVAIADNSDKAAYSADGVTWTSSTLPHAAEWQSVAYGNGKFVAVAENYAYALYSTDGITWTETAMPLTTTWKSVTYGNDRFVAVSYQTNVAAYSTDGVTWIEATLPQYSNHWIFVTYGNGKFVAVMDVDSKAAYSEDGITWTAATLPYVAQWCSVAYGNGKFVAIVDSSVKAAYSEDGITWTATTLPSSSEWKSVTYGNGKFVAVGCESAAVAYSIDGITWKDEYRFISQGTTDITKTVASVLKLNTKADSADLEALRTEFNGHTHEHTHSWNDLENRPFGEMKVIEPFEIEWDGNTDGRVIVDAGDGAALVKVSDVTPTTEELVSGSYTINGSQTSNSELTLNDLTEYGYPIVMLTAGALPVIAVAYSPTTIEGIHVPEAGLYVLSGMIETNFIVVERLSLDSVGRFVTKTIDHKYLPEALRFGEINNFVEIFPETSFDEDFLNNEPYINGIGELVVGNTYTVVYQGTEYDCVAVSVYMDGITCAGLGSIDAVMNNDMSLIVEPFIVLRLPSAIAAQAGFEGMFMTLEDAPTLPVTLAIHEGSAEFRKLDNKYIDSEWMATRTLEPVGEVLIPETAHSFSGSSANNVRLDDSYIPLLTEGLDVGVIWDSVTYKTTVHKTFIQTIEVLYVGNAAVVGFGSDTGEPFCIYVEKVEGLDPACRCATYSNEAGEHTFSVVYCEWVANKLPTEFLPSDFMPEGLATEEYVNNVTSAKADSADLEALRTEFEGHTHDQYLTELPEHTHPIVDTVTNVEYAININNGEISHDIASEYVEFEVTSSNRSQIGYTSNLTEFVIPSAFIGNDGIVYKVTSISSQAFSGRTSLTSITIPNSVTSIGDNAFYNCTGLTSVTIPDSVISIGNQAFYNCTSLTSITIPNSVTSIAHNAFVGCTSLTSITIPSSITSIGINVFKDCTGLTSIVISEGVTNIGAYTFTGCTGLTNVTFPYGIDGRTSNNAFDGCTGLTSVTIPNSMTYINVAMFKDCVNLTTVYYTGTEEEWNAITIQTGNECLVNATKVFNAKVVDIGDDTVVGTVGQFLTIGDNNNIVCTSGGLNVTGTTGQIITFDENDDAIVVDPLGASDAVTMLAECGLIAPVQQDGVIYTDSDGKVFTI